MGSTQGHERQVVHSYNVANNLITLGRFKEADKELALFASFGKDAAVLRAICDYRLGNEEALDRLEERYGDRLSDEQVGLVFRQEVLGHIEARRFGPAINLLHDEARSDKELADANTLMAALRVLDSGQRAARIKRNPHYPRVGFTTPVAERTRYLSEASKLCKEVADRNMQPEGEPNLIRTLSVYMLLLIEMSMSTEIRDNRAIVQYRRELCAVDESFRKSLPAYWFYRLVQYRRKF